MKRIPNTSLNNWREAPYSAWAFQNVRQLIPTTRIKAADNAAPPDTSAKPSEHLHIDSFLFDTHTDSFIMRKHGKVVFRWNGNHGIPENPHIIFSVSKSVTGMLAGILVEQGKLDPQQVVSHYLPEARNSAYSDCTIQQLLDMQVGLDFNEDYSNADEAFVRYRNATGWNPVDQTKKQQVLEAFLYSLQKSAEGHGGTFEYKSPNTDLMGLLLERIADQSYADLVSELLWQPMGARNDAQVTVDCNGLARAAGGVCCTAEDLALFGQLVLDSGNINGRQVIPESWILDTITGGDHAAWARGRFASLLPNGQYRNYWYQTGNDDHCFCAIGIHGQWLYINPRTQSVIVKFSSQPMPLDEPTDLRCLALFEQLTSDAPPEKPIREKPIREKPIREEPANVESTSAEPKRVEPPGEESAS